MTDTCPKHPDQKDFYVYEGKPSRCKACVRDQRQKWLEKKRQSAGSDGPADASTGEKALTPAPRPARAPDPKPAPARPKPAAPARTDWHWTWGHQPGTPKGPPSTSPDAWGPYKGLSDDELRRRKRNRGQPYMSGTMVWLSPEEWDAREKWYEEYKANLARKHGLK